jgi:glycosyltransferase involved in cell wall biosynthesis
MPRISVIVPFRDALGNLPGLVEGLRAQTLLPVAFEVIWVDDGSIDGGPAWLGDRLSAGWSLLRHDRPRGSYAARNTGLRSAASEHVAFIDVDCRPQPDWLARGLEALSTTPRVAGRIDFTLSDNPTLAELADSSRFLRQQRYVHEGFGATANLFVARQVFRTVGEFDERLRYGGDYEFGRRCLAAGIPIAYGIDVIVNHPARATLFEILRKGERVGYGAGQVFRLGRTPLRILVSRMVDRLSLAVRRGRSSSPNEQDRMRVAQRSVPVTAVLCLVMVTTAIGVIRGLLTSVPEVTRQ